MSAAHFSNGFIKWTAVDDVKGVKQLEHRLWRNARFANICSSIDNSCFVVCRHRRLKMRDIPSYVKGKRMLLMSVLEHLIQHTTDAVINSLKISYVDNVTAITTQAIMPNASADQLSHGVFGQLSSVVIATDITMAARLLSLVNSCNLSLHVHTCTYMYLHVHARA